MKRYTVKWTDSRSKDKKDWNLTFESKAEANEVLELIKRTDSLTLVEYQELD